MTVKYIVIRYDDSQEDCDGLPLDLYAYLVGEMDNADITAEVLESRSGLRDACCEFLEHHGPSPKDKTTTASAMTKT